MDLHGLEPTLKPYSMSHHGLKHTLELDPMSLLELDPLLKSSSSHRGFF